MRQGGVAAYSFLFELWHVEITRQVIPIRGLPSTLAGLRIVQITDLHHGPWTSLAYVRRVIEAANAEQADLVLLTGDYVHQSPTYIDPVVAELARLRGRIGVVGTLGNHDWWEDGVACMRAFHRVGIPLIDNNRLFVSGDRTLEKELSREARRDGLCLAGVGDLWEGQPNYHDALAMLPREMPRILLSHNPDVAEEKDLLNYAPRIDLMLSGHTHGERRPHPREGAEPRSPSRRALPGRRR